MSTCPICESRCSLEPRTSAFDRVVCARCGRFTISDTLTHATQPSIRHSRPALWLKLSYAVRLATDHGHPPPSLRTENLEEIVLDARPPKDPLDQLDTFIRAVYERVQSMGGYTGEGDSPLVWCARTATADWWALNALARQAQSEGLLISSVSETQSFFQTTAAGFRYYRDLQRPTASRRAFVAMRGDAHHSTYVHGLRPALEALGWLPYRPENDETHADQITDTIVANIRTCGLFVADLTDDRPNVYWELGFAMGLGIPFQITCQKGAPVHFDVHAWPRVEWDTPQDLAERLKARLDARGLRPA